MKTISAVRLVCAAALLAALLMLAGCARRADVCDVLAAALGSAPDRPEGSVYSTSAESGSEVYLQVWGAAPTTTSASTTKSSNGFGIDIPRISDIF